MIFHQQIEGDDVGSKYKIFNFIIATISCHIAEFHEKSFTFSLAISHYSI